MKSLIRSAIAAIVRFSGQLATAERRQRDTLTILCYHRVLPEARRVRYFDPDLVVTPEVFDSHCATLARHYEVVTLEKGLAEWRLNRATNRPRAAITFDDGYRDNETYAAPILARHGLKATFYIVAGLVGTEDQPWYDRAGQALVQLGRDPTGEVGRAKTLMPAQRRDWLANLEAEAGFGKPHRDDLIMDVAGLRRLVAAGHEIGSHTVTHPLLDQLPEADRHSEIVCSKEMLETASGADIVGFSYPNGNLNAAVKATVAQGKYAYAVSASPGVNYQGADMLALKRWFISQDRLCTPSGLSSPSLLRMEISGLSQRLFKRGVAS